MQKYLTQLIADIQVAKEDMLPPWIPKASYELDEWLPTDEDEQQAPKRSVEDWTGIKQEMLPPPEHLTEEQAATLLKVLEELLSEINCHWVTQIKVPVYLQYATIRRRWQQEHAWLMWHENFFDYCEEGQIHGSCGFGMEYCHCRFFAEMSKDWDKTPWTEEDETRLLEELEERRQRRKRDDWW